MLLISSQIKVLAPDQIISYNEMVLKKYYILFLVSLFLPLSAHARLFRNAYISFELPPKWNCNLEGTEWVCVSQFNDKSKEAIIILTAKEVGPSDSLKSYELLLKTAKTIPGEKGQPTTSQVIAVKQRKINDQPWIDGMHLGSEVTSYYTRYLATIKDNIAILVTFSAHKAHYTKYSQDFLKAIKSLQVVASKSLLSKKPLLSPRSSLETVGTPIGQILPTDINTNEIPQENSNSGSSSTTSIGFGLLIIAGLYWFFVMRKKSKGGK